MKYFPRLVVVILTAILSFPTQLYSQVDGFAYRKKITIAELENVNRTNYAVRLTIDTETLVSAGKMTKGGRDIRFADSCMTNLYDYFLEGGMNTSKTTVWVKIPKLDAKDSVDIYMFYGKPSALSASSLTSIFPKAFETSSKETKWSGVQNYDYIHIKKGHTILVDDTARLILNTRGLLVEGRINGTGKGHQQGTTTFADGKGPGGGFSSAASNAGGGGGAYGGDGGNGGYDTTAATPTVSDSIGRGGKKYGTEKGKDIAIGSSGGSGASYGAHGGGCVIINAEYITVEGSIIVDGASGVNGTTTAQMGGGGSGGGIKIMGKDVALLGTLSAKGGAGGPGAATVNDSGGGGGGGRVKTFYTGTLVNTGTIDVSGGLAGPYGTVLGEAGDTGTVYMEKGTSIADSFRVTMKTEHNIIPVLKISTNEICEGDTIIAIASGNFPTYNFLQSGVSVQNSSSNTYYFTGLKHNDVLKVQARFNSCINEADSAIITVYAKPSVRFEGDSVICEGDTAHINALGLTSAEWLDGIGTGRNASVVPKTTTYYRAYGINARGCTTIDSFKVTVNALPVVVIDGKTSACLNEKIELTAKGATTYMWNDNSTNEVIDFTPDTLVDQSFSVIGIDQNGCSNQASTLVTVNDLPTVDISGDTVYCAGDTVKLNASGATTYSWSTGSSSENESYVATTSQAVTVSGIDDNGCKSSDQQALKVNELPSIEISGDTLVCKDGSVTLTASGGVSYVWSTKEELESIEVSPIQAETFGVAGTDANGCINTTTHYVDIVVLDPSFEETTNLLTANADDVTYFWLDCDRDFRGISRDKTLEITKDGSYALMVEKYGCKDTSDCEDIKYVGIDEKWNDEISVYPNPSEGVFVVTVDVIEPVDLVVWTATGQQVMSKRFTAQTNIDLSDLPKGVYSLSLMSDERHAVKMLLKE